jgi:hypothetical protein
VEKYFLTRVSAADVDPARASQPDNIRENRWWTLAELRATAETVYPLGLADLVLHRTSSADGYRAVRCLLMASMSRRSCVVRVPHGCQHDERREVAEAGVFPVCVSAGSLPT